MGISLPPNKTCGDWQALLAAYRQNVRPDYTVLEIGSSTPERTQQLASACGKLIGVELMPERRPENHANIEYRLGDWQKLSQVVAPDSIDLAVSSHVLEHVPDDLAALNELHRVLKPGGTALLNTPNRKRLSRSIIELFTAEKKFPDWEHQREYIEKDLVELVERSRFTEFQVEPVVFGLHGGPVFAFIQYVPKRLRHWANFWQLSLTRQV